jgi:hypothetical protein
MVRRTLSLIGLTIAALALAALPGSAAVATTAHPVIIHSNATSATIHIPSSRFRVRVTATTASCWVQVTVGSHQVLYQGVLPPHRSRTFRAKNGAISVQLGSMHSKVAVLPHGKAVTHWRYTPTGSPFTYSFDAAT